MPMPSSSPKKRWATSPVSNDSVPEEDTTINSIGCQLVRSFEKCHQSGRALVLFACSVLRPGFCKFIQVCLRLIPLGAMICGPPCGSYVWVNRSTSRRSKKRPLGDCSKLYVRQNNTSFVSIWSQTHLYRRKHYLKGLDIWIIIGKMFRSSLGFCARLTMLAFLATCRSVYVAVEQPSSSLMPWMFLLDLDGQKDSPSEVASMPIVPAPAYYINRFCDLFCCTLGVWSGS